MPTDDATREAYLAAREAAMAAERRYRAACGPTRPSARGAYRYFYPGPARGTPERAAAVAAARAYRAARRAHDAASAKYR
jgi:hypothetical protein